MNALLRLPASQVGGWVGKWVVGWLEGRWCWVGCPVGGCGGNGGWCVKIFRVCLGNITLRNRSDSILARQIELEYLP